MRFRKDSAAMFRSLAGSVVRPLCLSIGLGFAVGLASIDASALPPPRPGVDAPHNRETKADQGERDGAAFEGKARDRRERMMRRIRVLKAVELGELLELDSADTVRLTQTLEPFDEERQKLRLANLELRRALRQVARGEAQGDVAELAKRAADNRVRLAEIDRRELEAVLTGLPPEKAAKATLFLDEFPRRMERLADEVKRGKHHRSRKEGERPPGRRHPSKEGERLKTRPVPPGSNG